jgi:hypothetical protein
LRANACPARVFYFVVCCCHGRRVNCALQEGGIQSSIDHHVTVTPQRNIMKRFFVLALAACIALVVCACERTEFEKKSERDADARRELNNKPKGSSF